MAHFTVGKAATSVGAEGVKATNIEAEAVTEPKLANNAVTVTKAKAAVAPVASGTESLTAEGGTNGIAKTALLVYNAKKEASAKVKVPHNLNREFVSVTSWKASAKKATEQALGAAAGAISSVKFIGVNECEVTLVAAEPASKEEIFFLVTG